MPSSLRMQTQRKMLSFPAVTLPRLGSPGFLSGVRYLPINLAHLEGAGRGVTRSVKFPSCRVKKDFLLFVLSAPPPRPGLQGTREPGARPGPSQQRGPSRSPRTRRCEAGWNFGLRSCRLGFPLKCRNSRPTPPPPPPGRLLPVPLRPRPGSGSSQSPGRGGLPATCPLPSPHAKRDRRGRQAGERPHRPCAAATATATASSSPTPSVCAYPACTSRPRAISELQPRGQSGRKKQEVWDGPSRGAGSPKRQALCLALPLPSPASSLWPTSLGSVSGAGLNSKNPDVFGGHSRRTPRVPSP